MELVWPCVRQAELGFRRPPRLWQSFVGFARGQNLI
jgi:hypothetical protein